MNEMVPFDNSKIVNNTPDDFINLINNLFNSIFNDTFPDSSSFIGASFKADMLETSSSYIIKAEIPGVSKEAIQVEYENNYLTLCVRREDIMEDTRYEQPRRARFYGELRRSFYTPDINEDNIHASLRNGQLTIELPKLNNYKRKRRIDKYIPE